MSLHHRLNRLQAVTARRYPTSQEEIAARVAGFDHDGFLRAFDGFLTELAAESSPEAFTAEMERWAAWYERHPA